MGTRIEEWLLMASIVSPSPSHMRALNYRELGAFLRAPGERAALAYCVVANFVVLALAIAIILAGTDWLATHPFVAKHIDAIRGVLFAALVAVPATIVGRQSSLPGARGGGVRVGPKQLPELHGAFLRACRELGLTELPDLYVSHECDWPATAHAARGQRPVVVLNARLVERRWKDDLDSLTFIVAGALGDVRLGHTRWWIEVLTVYTRVLPWLRTPLLVKWVASRDRCAAFVAPDGIRGLVAEAVGAPTLPSVDVAAFLEQTKEKGGFWELIDTIRHQRQPITARARELYDAGFLDLERDQARFGTPAG